MLKILLDRSGSVRFKDLIEILGVDARAVFKNLFFLEEKGYVQLSTSNPSDAVYPQIHLIRIRKNGEALAKDHENLDSTFPLSDTTTDTRPHIPPDFDHEALMTFAQVLEVLAARVRTVMIGDERDAALERIESLLSVPVVNEPVTEKSGRTS